MVRESLIPQWWFLSATDLCFECSLEVTVQLTFPCSDFERVHKISPFLQGSYRFSCRQARDIGVLCLFPHPLCPAHGQGVGFLKNIPPKLSPLLTDCPDQDPCRVILELL